MGQAAIQMIGGMWALFGVLALLLFLLPRTPKYTVGAMLFVLVLAVPFLLLLCGGH